MDSGIVAVVFKVVLLSRIILSFQERLDQKAVSSVGVIADATSKVNIYLVYFLYLYFSSKAR